MKSAWVIASIIVLVGGGLGNYLRFSEVLPDRPVAFERIPLKGGAFQGEEQRFAQISYEVLQADTSTLRLYQNAEGIINNRKASSNQIDLTKVVPNKY